MLQHKFKEIFFFDLFLSYGRLRCDHGGAAERWYVKAEWRVGVTLDVSPQSTHFNVLFIFFYSVPLGLASKISHSVELEILRGQLSRNGGNQ